MLILCVAIQAAKLAGHAPIITTASPHSAALLTSFGATHVLDRALPATEILTRISAITEGVPVEYVYDAISLPDTQSLGYAALAPGGTLVLTLPCVIPDAERAEGSEVGKKIVQGHGLASLPGNEKLATELFKRLPEWLEKGVFKVRLCYGDGVCQWFIVGVDFGFFAAESRRGAPERIGRYPCRA